MAHNSNAPFLFLFLFPALSGKRGARQGKARAEQSEGKRATTPQNLEKPIHMYKNHMYSNTNYCILSV